MSGTYIDRAELVPAGGPAHPDMWATLTLLRMDDSAGVVYFIVRGAAIYDSLEALQEHERFFYEEHTCPTNFIDVEAIFTPDDDDPHGVFTHLRTVWMPANYAAAVDAGNSDAMLRELFPETRSPANADPKVAG